MRISIWAPGKTAVVFLATLATCLVVAPPASAGHHWLSVKETKCYSGDMAQGGIVVKMGTTAHKKNNLQELRLKARLIPADQGAGWSWGSAWGKEQSYSKVSADGDNGYFLGANTGKTNHGHDYNLQYKARWDRRGKSDWVDTRTLRWDGEQVCPPSIVGGSRALSTDRTADE